MKKSTKTMLTGLAITAGVVLVVNTIDKAYQVTDRTAPMLPNSKAA